MSFKFFLGINECFCQGCFSLTYFNTFNFAKITQWFYSAKYRCLVDNAHRPGQVQYLFGKLHNIEPGPSCVSIVSIYILQHTHITYSQKRSTINEPKKLSSNFCVNIFFLVEQTTPLALKELQQQMWIIPSDVVPHKIYL